MAKIQTPKLPCLTMRETKSITPPEQWRKTQIQGQARPPKRKPQSLHMATSEKSTRKDAEQEHPRTRREDTLITMHTYKIGIGLSYSHLLAIDNIDTMSKI